LAFVIETQTRSEAMVELLLNWMVNNYKLSNFVVKQKLFEIIFKSFK